MIAAASDSFLVAIATVGMHIIPRNGLFAWKKSIPLSVTFLYCCDGISLCNNSIMVDGIILFDESIIVDEISAAIVLK